MRLFASQPLYFFRATTVRNTEREVGWQRALGGPRSKAGQTKNSVAYFTSRLFSPYGKSQPKTPRRRAFDVGHPRFLVWLDASEYTRIGAAT